MPPKKRRHLAPRVPERSATPRKQAFCAVTHAEEREAHVRATIVRHQARTYTDPPQRASKLRTAEALRPRNYDASAGTTSRFPTYKWITFPFIISEKEPVQAQPPPREYTERRRNRLVISACPHCAEPDKVRVTLRTVFVVYVRCNRCGHGWTQNKPSA